MASADHIPISLLLNIESLPELTRYANDDQSVKIDWSRATEKDIWQYKVLTNRGLSDINIPSEAILCHNINCKNHKHNTDLCIMY